VSQQPSLHLDFFKLLSGELAPETLLLKFLMLLLRLQDVERGSIWVRSEGGFVCVEAAGAQCESIKGLRLPQDKPSIVGWVMANGTMTVAEAGRDARHFKDAENGLAVKSSLILGFPLLVRDGSVYGVVEIIDVSAGGDRMNLDQGYLEFLQNIVDVGSIALSNSLEFTAQAREKEALRQALESMRQDGPAVGPSPAFGRILSQAAGFARTDYPVLITGESGVGKELMAREVHRLSARAGKPFLAQNCSAIPSTLLASELFGYKKGAFTGAYKDKAGLFEAARGGTVFLDEIGDMPPDLQAALLRVLQEREVKPLGGAQAKTVDVRIIAATNKDLATAMAKGEFREDLFYRLSVLPLRLPALRERPEDIPYLWGHFMQREAARLGLPPKALGPGALDALLARPWRGNVRELENLVKHTLVAAPGPLIHAEDLGPADPGAANRSAAPQPAAPADPFAGHTWESLERAFLEDLLARHKWNVSRAARQAGVNRSTFDSRMRRLGIRKI
jgi:transcriptional regulator with GAF, ATPase, and Fis domain